MNRAIEDAVRYIVLELKKNSNADKLYVIEYACQKYDLNPLQSEYLINKYLFNA